MRGGRRVVVTGLGVVSPLGNDVETFWTALLSGKSGAAKIKLFDPRRHRTQFACEVKGFDASQYLSHRDIRRTDRFTQLSIAAAQEGIQDAFQGDFSKVDKDNVGVIWGSGIGGLITMGDQVSDAANQPEDQIFRFSPLFIPKVIIDIAAGWISMIHGFKGPNYGVVSACASAAHTLVNASAFIRSGQNDVIICGGGEAGVCQLSLAGFNASKALSEDNDRPTEASRPFDKTRNGFVLGEGGACLVLESYEHAKARGAKIYAELAGCGSSGDAHHVTAPDPEGKGISLAMNYALKDAGMKPEDITYVNPHATSTLLGDEIEVQTIERVFGNHSKNLYLNGTKSMTGHLLGAAGGLEAVISVLVLHRGRIPPTINHFELDDKLNPELDYCFSPPKEPQEIGAGLSNSFGFGGHNASLIFRRWHD